MLEPVRLASLPGFRIRLEQAWRSWRERFTTELLHAQTPCPPFADALVIASTGRGGKFVLRPGRCNIILICMGAGRKAGRILVVPLLLGSVTEATAQSWLPADRVGERRYKSWDEIPVGRSTTSTAALFNAPPTPIPTDGSYRTVQVAALERRLRPEAGELKQYFQDVLSAKSDRDVKTAGWRLDLPNAEEWFSKQFGPELGAALMEEYQGVRRTLGSDFLNLIKGLRGRKQTVISVQLVRSAADPDANPLQRAALQRMAQPVPLYELRFTRPGKPGGFSIYSFAYIDGMFRFLGKMQAATHASEAAREEAASTGTWELP